MQTFDILNCAKVRPGPYFYSPSNFLHQSKNMEHTPEASKASFFIMLLYTVAYVIMLGLVSTDHQDDVIMTSMKVYILLSIGITGRVCLSEADFPMIENSSVFVRIYFMVIGLIFYASFVRANR